MSVFSWFLVQNPQQAIVFKLFSSEPSIGLCP